MAGLLAFYEHLTKVGKPFLDYLLTSRVKKGKEDPARLNERRGQPSRPRPIGQLVWVHAASVGEAQSALILIDAMEKIAAGINVMVTTGTRTSASLMERRLPVFAFHQYVPMDHPAWVASFLDHWRPDIALWMESELWPNMILSLKARHIPAVLVNARLSDRSFSRWKLAPSAAEEILDCFDLILTQTDKDKSRFQSLGAPHAQTGGNIKYSADPLPYDDMALSALSLAVEGRRTWVYASTHAGEESLACRIHKRLKENVPDLLTIIVPRHPERRDNIAQACFENGVTYRLRSHNAALPAPDDDVYIADTLGELGLFYTLCPIAMIGRSFSDDGGGGHNPIEAAQLGCAVLTGPNNQYQRQIYDDMAAQDAVLEMKDEDALYSALMHFLQNPAELQSRREKTIAFTRIKQDVIANILKSITPLMNALGNKHAA